MKGNWSNRAPGLSGIRWQPLQLLRLVLVCLCVGFCGLEWQRFHVLLDVPGGRVSKESDSDFAHRLVEGSGTAKVLVHVVEHGDRRARRCSQTAARQVVPGPFCLRHDHDAEQSGDENVRVEFREMRASYEFRKHHEPGFLALIKDRSMWKRLCYGFYVMALQQVGGIAAITMYAALIYQSLGWDDGNQALAINGIQAILQLFSVLVNTFTVDKYGRRQLLIVGFSIQSVAILILSSLTTAYPDNNNKAAAIVEIAMLFIVGMTYCWSNGPIPPTVASEIFPQHVRDKAFGISALGQTIFLIAITQPWPTFNAAVGPLSYWLLAGLNLVALVSVVFILPE